MGLGEGEDGGLGGRWQSVLWSLAGPWTWAGPSIKADGWQAYGANGCHSEKITTLVSSAMPLICCPHAFGHQLLALMQRAPQLRQALGKVATAVAAMEAAESIQQFESAWKDFLHSTERLWNKSLAHFKKSPKWAGWAGRYFQDRSRDQLLSYLINARGAEEHTVEPITAVEGGGFGINPAEGNSLYLERMEINNGVLSVKSPQALKITFFPARTKLLPVTNRGRVYPVPASHCGGDIDPTNVVSIARTAATYYGAFLDEAEKFFCGADRSGR